MRKLFLTLCLFALLISGCASWSSRTADSPCDSIMTEVQFADKYEGEYVTFRGVYSGSTVYAYEVGGKIVCATTLEDAAASIPGFRQDIVLENGEHWADTIPIFGADFNGVIGSSGILEVERYENGDLLDIVIRDTDEVLIVGRPDKCTELSTQSIMQWNGKEIEVIGASNDGNGWDDLYFKSGSENYCYEDTVVQVLTSVVDITGKKVLANDYSWGGSLYHLMNLKGTIMIDPSRTVNTPTSMTDTQPVIFVVVGDATSSDYGDPMVFEIKSRPASIHYVMENTFGNRYKLVNSTKPEKVNPGYVYSPDKYVDGGELIAGVVMGEVEGVPFKITGSQCAFGGVDFQPVQSVKYTDNEGSGYIIAVPDSYLYFVEGTGQDQVITYYHVPALQPECPTEYK